MRILSQATGRLQGTITLLVLCSVAEVCFFEARAHASQQAARPFQSEWVAVLCPDASHPEAASVKSVLDELARSGLWSAGHCRTAHTTP